MACCRRRRRRAILVSCAIVVRPPIRVTQAAEGLRDGLEGLISPRGLVLVRVQLKGQLPICLLDVIVGRCLGKTKDGIEVTSCLEDVFYKAPLFRRALKREAPLHLEIRRSNCSEEQICTYQVLEVTKRVKFESTVTCMRITAQHRVS